jgi:vinculin
MVVQLAAHDLHQEVTKWSSEDNDIVAAAKRVALLMGKLSRLVSDDCASTKRELISVSKAISEAATQVHRIAHDLALSCTDKRMRMVRSTSISTTSMRVTPFFLFRACCK